MKKSKRFNPVTLIFVLIAVVFALVSKAPAPQATSVKTPGTTVSTETWLRVAHVTDGDTIRLSNGEKVRLIGIDTPELHESAKLYRDAERTGRDVATIKRMGNEAYLFTRSLLDGKIVRLEFDVQRRDKYGRTLAYVYLEDGTFVNAEIIKKGYAYPMAIPPDIRHAEEFRAFFTEARKSRLGLWAQEPEDRHEPSR